MQNFPIFLRVVIAIFFVGALGQLIFLIVDSPWRDVVVGICWLLMLGSMLWLVRHCIRTSRYADDMFLSLEERAGSMTTTLMAAETALSEKSRTIADYEAESARLNEQNNTYKQQLALMRNEVASSKTRLGEYRQLMEELRDRAEMGESLKAAFVANIHDELRNPLNAITGYLSLLSNSSLSEAKRTEYIDRISRDANHFLDVVNDLFYYAKLVVGDMSVSVSSFNIKAVLVTAVSMARHWVEEKGKSIEVRLNMPESDGGYIRGFEGGFIKILNNLVSNAVKFTQEGHIDVSCTIQRGKVIISVEDTGIGIDADKRDLIFDGFYQVDYYLTRKFGGTGLGLSICRALARKMGGSISVDSHKGVGSRFTLEVPMLEADAPELDLFSRVDRLLSAKTDVGKVMVITPFNEDYDFVNGFFAHYGISVLRSSTRDETNALLREYEDIKLVVIDLYSSQLEGVTAAESIFKERPNVRMAFISGSSLNPAQMEVVGMYSDHVLSKPLTSLALSKVMVDM